MRKFLLTLTAAVITTGAASTAAQAAWVYHRPGFVVAGPTVITAPIVVAAPVYLPPVVSQVVYTEPVFPVFYDQHVVHHRWHDWAHRYY